MDKFKPGEMYDTTRTEGWKSFEEVAEEIGWTEEDIEIFWKAFDETVEDLKGEDTEKIRKILKNLPKNAVSEKLYDILPNSVVTDLLKKIAISLPFGREIAASKNVKVKTQETLNGKYLLSYSGGNEEYEIRIDNVQAWKSKRTVQLRKALNFLLIKANEQNYPDKIYFQLEDYMQKTGIESKDAAYRAAKRELETLMGFKVTGVRKRGKKETRHAVEYVFTGRDISYNECYVKCIPGHVEMICQYFSLLPQWAGELKKPKAYDLLDYIYYMARMKNNQESLSKSGHFNISLKALNSRIGGHNPEETDRHTQFIINPILDAIDEIEVTQKNGELKISPHYGNIDKDGNCDFNYKNGYDFLEGYIRIAMEPTAFNYFLERNEERKKEIKKSVSKAVKKD